MRRLTGMVGLILAATLASPPPTGASAPMDLGGSFDAIEAPVVEAEIEPPPSLRVGRAELVPQPGARAYLLSAQGRPCGIVIDGPAKLTYSIEDRFAASVARRNLRRVSGFEVRDAGDAIVLTGLLKGVAVFGFDLPAANAARLRGGGASMPAWLVEILGQKLMTSPGRELLLNEGNDDSGYAWAVFHGSEDLFLDVDARASVGIETLGRFRRIEAGEDGRRLGWEQHASQPIGRRVWDPVVADFQSTDVRIKVVNDREDHALISTTLTLTMLRPRTRLLDLVLANQTSVSDSDRRLRITRLSVNGAPAAFLHRRGTLLVAIPEPSEAGQTITLDVETEGRILQRPAGDNYWALLGAWYPRPSGRGQEQAAFSVSVEARQPFVPFGPGEIVERAGGDRPRVVTRLKGPMEAASVLAGRYVTISEEVDGTRFHVSSYAGAKESESRRLGRNMHAVRACLADWLGTPYPFQDLQVVEINAWGFGQAPPGFVFITKEAFLSQARVAMEDSPLAGLVSRGTNERIAHEIAHGWFPHVMKIASPEENWLSESFAEYTSAVCLQRIDPDKGRGRRIWERQISDWKSEANGLGAGASVYLASHLAGGEDDWWTRNRLLYGKGPLVLHALRQQLARDAGSESEGDRQFLVWVRSLIRNFTYKVGGTPHLVGILNQLTKRDWQPWFERYVYGTETPALN